MVRVHFPMNVLPPGEDGSKKVRSEASPTPADSMADFMLTGALECRRAGFGVATADCRTEVRQILSQTATLLRRLSYPSIQQTSRFERKEPMNVSVSNAISSSPSQAAASTQSSTSTQPSEPVRSSAAPADDSVKLSQAAQVHLMKQQGQALSQIAADLGISAATVDGYLGIAVPKAPVSAAPTASPAAPAATPGATPVTAK